MCSNIKNISEQDNKQTSLVRDLPTMQKLSLQNAGTAVEVHTISNSRTPASKRQNTTSPKYNNDILLPATLLSHPCPLLCVVELCFYWLTALLSFGSLTI
jgi:hypothetical protein